MTDKKPIVVGLDPANPGSITAIMLSDGEMHVLSIHQKQMIESALSGERLVISPGRSGGWRTILAAIKNLKDEES